MADHYLGANISYKSLGGLTYQITVVTYTGTEHPHSDKDALTAYSGDGTAVQLTRINGGGKGETITKEILKSIYQGQYTYFTEGNYKIYVTEPYRHASIDNIDNGKSAAKKLYIDALVPVNFNPQVCVNNGVEYQLNPIFYAYEGVDYATNLGVFDSDGDSLVFSLIDCRGANGITLPNYTVQSTVTVNAKTGTLSWSNPKKGIYSYSILTTEYRKGKKIGSTSADFLVFVGKEFKSSPIFIADAQFNNNELTVNAGGTIKFTNSISYEGTHVISYSVWNNGGKTISQKTKTTPSSVSDTMQWITNSSDGRTAPYIIVQRFSITENDKTLTKDFAMLIYVKGNFLVTCLSPDVESVKETPPELADFIIAPTLFRNDIYMNVGSNYEGVKLFIYDMQGKEMVSYSNFTQSTVNLNLQHLAPAVYVVVLWKEKEDKRIIVKRIVKIE